MFGLKKLAGLAAAALVASAMAVTAAPVISVSNTLPAPVANPLATSKTNVGTGVLENVIGNQCSPAGAFNCQSGIFARSPWEGTANHATGQYTSISANNTATYTPGGLFNQVSFVWGSPDTYNTLEIVLSGPGGSTDTVIPSNTNGLLPPAGSLAKFVIVSNVVFDTVTFKSGQNAFEFANLTLTPVPLPAAGLLLFGALGGLGLVARRRKAA